MSLGGVRAAAGNWPPFRRQRRVGKPDRVRANLPDRIETPEEIHDVLVGLANSYEEDIAQFDREEISPAAERATTTTTARTTEPPPPIVWFPSEPECPGTDSEKSETTMFLFV